MWPYYFGATKSHFTNLAIIIRPEVDPPIIRKEKTRAIFRLGASGPSSSSSSNNDNNNNNNNNNNNSNNSNNKFTFQEKFYPF